MVLTGFANAGFSGTWAVSEMSMSVATASDRAAAVAAFEEATVAAVAEDLVDADTLDVLEPRGTRSRARVPSRHPGALVHRRVRSGRGPESPIQVAILRASSSSAP